MRDFVEAAKLQNAYKKLADAFMKLPQLLAEEDFAGPANLQDAYENDYEKPDESAAVVEEHDGEEEEEVASDTEESSAAESQANDETRVLKMLKGKIFKRPKHDFYKQTRCTSTAQEEQSALPVGVINRHEDSSEDKDCYGEGKEMANEAQELRAAAHWINQSGWDTASEGRAVSPTTGQ